MEIIIAVVALITLGIASYTDLKSREVPDWLNYSMIAAALGVRSIFAVDDWPILISGILGFGAMFVVACFLYYTNQWGGGDSKLLMGMGAAIGIQYPFEAQSFSLFWFFVALLFLGAMYGILYLIWTALHQGKRFWKDYCKTIGSYRKLHLGMWITSIWIALTGLLVPFLFYISIIPIALFYLLFFVNCVEENCFIQQRATKKLTEGDWLAEAVQKQGKTILEKKTLERGDIALLHRQKIASVIIKEGIPFVPSFLFAYLLFLFSKDLLLNLF